MRQHVRNGFDRTYCRRGLGLSIAPPPPPPALYIELFCHMCVDDDGGILFLMGTHTYTDHVATHFAGI